MVLFLMCLSFGGLGCRVRFGISPTSALGLQPKPYIPEAFAQVHHHPGIVTVRDSGDHFYVPLIFHYFRVQGSPNLNPR